MANILRNSHFPQKSMGNAMKDKEAPVYIWHWILIIAGVFVAFVARRHLHKAGHVEFVPAPLAHGAGDTRFVTIFYPRISEEPESNSMSRKLFLEHMTMLKDAGYSTVGLQQVCDLYYAGRLLPEKVVVVLLEGFRDTCISALPVIQGLGLRATVMINVEAMRRNNHSFMSWHDLKKMQRHRHWDFGIAANDSSGLQEQLEYMRDRFANIRVCGISGPIDFNHRVPLTHERLLFFPRRDGDGYNSIATDPSCLNVLRIGPKQDHDELAHLLSNVFSKSLRFEDEFGQDTMKLNWTSTCGDTSVRDGALELSAGPSQSSADIWFAGTHDWGDVDLGARFRVIGGRQLWAYVRFRDEGNYVRLGCDGKRLYLQQRVAGAKVRNLKVVEYDSDFSEFHDLRLMIRNRYATAFLDGKRLSQRPFRVDDSLVSGKVGFAIWNPVHGIASCEIDRASVRKLPCIALIDAGWHKGAYRCIAEHSDYLSYLCPNGLRLASPHAACNIDDYEALLISAAYRGHELTPTVTLEESDLGLNDPGTLAGELTNLVEKYRFAGLHLDCRGCQCDESFTALAEVSATLKTNLPESLLILSLPPQCYQTCEELLRTADVLALPLEGRPRDLLDNVARPFRLKTLLRVETDEPCVFLENLAASGDAESTIDSVSSTMSIVQDYELKGIALCER